MDFTINRKQKIFISLPLRGNTDEENKNRYKSIKLKLQGAGYDVVDSYHEEKYPIYDVDYSGKTRRIEQLPVWMFGNSIRILAACDCIFMAVGWHRARGCKLEHEIAEKYGIKIIYEEDEEVALKLSEGQEYASSKWIDVNVGLPDMCEEESFPGKSQWSREVLVKVLRGDGTVGYKLSRYVKESGFWTCLITEQLGTAITHWAEVTI